MLYFDFEAGNKAYKLRLNTRNTVALEKALGCNPLAIFDLKGEALPSITQMVTVLHASLQQYQHGITIDDACNIFDDYLQEHTMTDFINVIIEVYKVSGIIPKDAETKN